MVAVPQLTRMFSGPVNTKLPATDIAQQDQQREPEEDGGSDFAHRLTAPDREAG